jgi:hypothetical protein
MGTWNGEWSLQIASGTAFKEWVVGNFTLTKVDDETYEVTSMDPPAKWQGVQFKLRPGSPGPQLGWPLLNHAKPHHSMAAGSWITETVKQQWDASHLQYECLEAEVPLGQAVKTIMLFKSDEAFEDGDDYLVGIRKDYLDDNSLPDGSVSGRRR